MILITSLNVSLWRVFVFNYVTLNPYTYIVVPNTTVPFILSTTALTIFSTKTVDSGSSTLCTDKQFACFTQITATRKNNPGSK